MAGNAWEVVVTLVLSQALMKSLGLMHPLLPSFGRELNDMTTDTSSIGWKSSPGMGNCDNASVA